MDAATPDLPRRSPDRPGHQPRGPSHAGAGPLHDAAPPAGSVRADVTFGLAITVDRTARRPVVVVHGELDATGEPLLAAVLEHVAATDGAPVLADLSDVSDADTHGLLPALRRDVVIVAASPQVRRLLAALVAPRPRRIPAPVPGRRARRPIASGPSVHH